MSGLICHKENIFDKMRDGKMLIILILFLLSWLLVFTDIPQSLFWPLATIGFTYFFCVIPFPTIIQKVNYLLGKYSTIMWLTHSFLIYKLIQSVIYYFHYSVLNLFVLIIVDLPLSILLARIYNCMLNKKRSNYENTNDQ